MHDRNIDTTELSYIGCDLSNSVNCRELSRSIIRDYRDVYDGSNSVTPDHINEDTAPATQWQIIADRV